VCRRARRGPRRQRRNRRALGHPGGHGHLHDLDLATTQGSTALYGRISEAAHKVCAASDIRDLKALAATYACERDAVSQAVREVHSTPLASRR